MTATKKTTQSKSFDLTTVYNEGRPLSWSAISSFEWNPRQWYDKYVSGEKPLITPELEFGSMIDTKIQDDPTFLPDLVRYPILQHRMEGLYNGIPLIGYADTYSKPWYETNKPGRVVVPAAVRDYKTGRKPWDQKRADETGQLTMYLLMLESMNQGLVIEDVELYIDWLPTHIKDGKIAFRDDPVVPITFKTKRTKRDLLLFRERISNTWKAMQEYAEKQATFASDDMSSW